MTLVVVATVDGNVDVAKLHSDLRSVILPVLNHYQLTLQSELQVASMEETETLLPVVELKFQPKRS